MRRTIDLPDPETLAALQATLTAAGLAGTLEIYLAADLFGRCIVALLLNALAKQDPALYVHKAPLVRWAVALAPVSAWWADTHEYFDYGKRVIFIEAAGWQFSFHFAGDEAADLFDRAPAANGRHWSGIRLQEQALFMAQTYAGLYAPLVALPDDIPPPHLNPREWS